IHLSNDISTTPLWEAIRRQNFQMIKRLYRAGADLNQHCFTSPIYGEPAKEAPIAFVVYWKNAKITQYLLDQGARITNDMLVDGKPLYEYAWLNAPDVYKILLGHDTSTETVQQIISQASTDSNALSNFLSDHPISEQMLERALVESIRAK